MALRTRVYRADTVAASAKRIRVYRLDAVAATPPPTTYKPTRVFRLDAVAAPPTFKRTRVYRLDGTAPLPPTVTMGPAQTVDPNLVDTITLTATGAPSTGGSIASYTWDDVTSGTTTVGGGATRSTPVVRSTLQTVRTYRVTVTDNYGLTVTGAVAVTLLPHTRWVKTAGALVPLRLNTA